MKRKINLYISWGFGEYNCSSDKNYNKLVEWVYDGSSDISFYSDHQLSLALTHNDDKKKYGWSLEPPSILPEVEKYIIDNYDLLSFHFQSIFTYNKKLLALGPLMKQVPSWGPPWIQKREITKKTKLISMISSNKSMCEGHRYRLQWAEKLKDKVDLYGNGFNRIETKEEGIEDYMFSVAMENVSMEAYYTEKIVDCFAMGTIPVYWGCSNIGEYFNEDGIIKLTDDFDISQLSADLYYSKMEAIRENFEITCNLPTVEDYIYENYLEGKK